ncbi:MAG TPA: MFS transporter [Vicinamibacterales bacterium]|jgi:MFS family permease|nr:MFS transporter [Vicinamibacterales bacterium]
MTRALRHRNYRLFFSGQSVSLIGTWITRIATSWLVYRLTGSELLLGVVGFCGQVPTLVLAPFAGVIVDRADRQRILIMTQILSMLQSAALAALTFSGRITVTEILLLQVGQGFINAFDTPARQAFVVEMVEDRADMANAIALNSSMVNGSRIIGPSIGGAIIAAVGEGWCFTIDAVSYLFVIASLVAMHVTARGHAERVEANVLQDLRDGWQYVLDSVPIRTALLVLAIVSTMAMPYTVLMPAVVTQVLHGGPSTLGFLMTMSGVGALAGALYLAQRTSVVGLGQVVMYATLAFGAGLIGFSVSRSELAAAAVLTIVGAGFILQMAATNTVLQTLVDDRVRGRVMAFYTMAFFGSAPIGSLLAGVVADRIGAETTIGLCGAVCVITGLWFAGKLPSLRAIVRPIYIERGILPVPAVDMGTKTL